MIFSSFYVLKLRLDSVRTSAAHLKPADQLLSHTSTLLLPPAALARIAVAISP